MLVNQLSKCVALVAIFLSATASPVPRPEVELIETRDAEHKLVPRLGGPSGSVSSASSGSLSALEIAGATSVGGSAAAGAIGGSSGSSGFVPSTGPPVRGTPSTVAITSNPDGSSPLNGGMPPMNFYTCKTFRCGGVNGNATCRTSGCGSCNANGTCTAPIELTPLPPKPLPVSI